MLKIIADSHVDHGLTKRQIAEIQERFADRKGFFIESFHLIGAKVNNALYGPIVGDKPIKERDVFYKVRGERKGFSRMVRAPLRKTNIVTVIAGPDGDEPLVLYTAYGGPYAPREPWDTSMKPAEVKESVAFWKDHALSWKS